MDILEAVNPEFFFFPHTPPEVGVASLPSKPTGVSLPVSPNIGHEVDVQKTAIGCLSQEPMFLNRSLKEKATQKRVKNKT